MNKISSVIIDDEVSNRELVRSLVNQLNSSFTISGEAASVSEGYKLINAVKPEVVFLDIKMSDGTGFDLLQLFDKINFEVIFITGFDEYALKAFEYNALDYVLKPINFSKFNDMLDKVQSRVMNNFSYFENIKKIIAAYDSNEAIITKIPIHYNDKVILLGLKEIMYIQAQEGCTCFYKSQKEKYTSSKQLSDFDFILENFPNYLKITKGAYINLDFIASYSKGFECAITMKDGSVHEISRRKKTQILEALTQNKKN